MLPGTLSIHSCTPHSLLRLLQSAKHAKLAARKRLTAEQAQGFLSSGLFRFSRHPNFWQVVARGSACGSMRRSWFLAGR